MKQKGSFFWDVILFSRLTTIVASLASLQHVLRASLSVDLWLAWRYEIIKQTDNEEVTDIDERYLIYFSSSASLTTRDCPMPACI